jgi:hypothetical protein
MSKLVEIPLIDIRGGTPFDLVTRFPDKARALASAVQNTFGLATRAVTAVGFPLTDRASRNWLVRGGNPYLPEIDRMANALSIRGVYTLNVCFEWGCTTGVWNRNDRPELHRVLDWAFPTLGESMMVAHQNGPAGDFYNITWPGLSGSFQGLAPGRFALAINQAPMRRQGASYVGDWARNRLAVRKHVGLPPAHLLRQVMETAPDYAAARDMLLRTVIAVPAIFILSGTQAGEGCVIERTETDGAIRALDGSSVCVANHFETSLDAAGKGWRARPIDSAGRVRAARALGEESFATPFAWFKSPIANKNSRLAFSADAAAGTLRLIGTAGPKPVTAEFRLG